MPHLRVNARMGTGTLSKGMHAVGSLGIRVLVDRVTRRCGDHRAAPSRNDQPLREFHAETPQVLSTQQPEEGMGKYTYTVTFLGPLIW